MQRRRTVSILTVTGLALLALIAFRKASAPSGSIDDVESRLEADSMVGNAQSRHPARSPAVRPAVAEQAEGFVGSQERHRQYDVPLFPQEQEGYFKALRAAYDEEPLDLSVTERETAWAEQKLEEHGVEPLLFETSCTRRVCRTEAQFDDLFDARNLAKVRLPSDRLFLPSTPVHVAGRPGIGFVIYWSAAGRAVEQIVDEAHSGGVEPIL